MARRAGRRTLGWMTIRRILTILSIIVYIYIYKRGEIGKIDLECDFRFFPQIRGRRRRWSRSSQSNLIRRSILARFSMGTRNVIQTSLSPLPPTSPWSLVSPSSSFLLLLCSPHLGLGEILSRIPVSHFTRGTTTHRPTLENVISSSSV